MNEMYIAMAAITNNLKSGIYIIGIYQNLDKAIKAAEDEENFRGGKYVCYVQREIANREPNSQIEDDTLILDYKTPSYILAEKRYVERIHAKFDWMGFYANQEDYISDVMKTINDIEFKVSGDESFHHHADQAKIKIINTIIPILETFQHNARLRKREAAKG